MYESVSNEGFNDNYICLLFNDIFQSDYYLLDSGFTERLFHENGFRSVFWKMEFN